MARGKLAYLCGLALAGTAAAGNDRLCIQNTGGMCSMSDCAAFRGTTTCDKAAGFGRCFCPNGGCSGTDEVCYDATAKPYAEIGGPGQVYQIRNARFPAQYLQMRDSVTGAVLTSEDRSLPKSGFTLVLPPAGLSMPAYLLYSDNVKDFAVIITSAEKRGYQTVGWRITGTLLGAGADPPISFLGLRLTRAPVAPADGSNTTLIMISGSTNSDQYMFLPAVSTTASIGGWDVRIQKNDPGAGGYWVFEPPLPASVISALQPYSGPRCSWYCGDAVAGAASGLRASMWALAAVAAAAASLSA